MLPKKLPKFIGGMRVMQSFEEVAFLWNFAKALNFATIPQNFQFFAIFEEGYCCGACSPAVRLLAVCVEQNSFDNKSSRGMHRTQAMQGTRTTWYSMMFSCKVAVNDDVSSLPCCPPVTGRCTAGKQDWKKLKVSRNCSKVQRFCKIP